MSEILPFPINGRPVTIKYQGWTEYISIRDQAFLQEKRSWRKRLADSHPDRHPTRKKTAALNFRRLMTKYLVWKKLERQQYWNRGLMPPDWKGSTPVPPPGYRLTPNGRWVWTTGGMYAGIHEASADSGRQEAGQQPPQARKRLQGESAAGL